MAGVAAAIVLLSPGLASAGAWTQPKGKGQVILKAEAMKAEEAFDPGGNRVGLAVERSDTTLGVFAEYGLTDRLTVQFKSDWQDGEDQFVDYQGRGPIEAALVWQLWRDERAALSVQAGYAYAGEGRNAGYLAPGQGSGDAEVRVSGGWSFGEPRPGRGWVWRLYPRRSFVELQVARRFRGGLEDETRADLTIGRHLGRHWMVLNQTYAGQVDGGDVRWINTETSLVRQVGRWSVQAGWRSALAGRETPASSGPVLALWRRF
jgi:hypothetical protein